MTTIFNVHIVPRMGAHQYVELNVNEKIVRLTQVSEKCQTIVGCALIRCSYSCQD